MYILFIVLLICEFILTLPIVVSAIFYLKEDRRDYKLLGASVGWLMFHLVHKPKPQAYNLEQQELHKQLNEVLDSVRGQDFSELNTLLTDLPKRRNYEGFKELIEKARPKPKETHVFVGDWDGSFVPYLRIHTNRKTIPNELNMEED